MTRLRLPLALYGLVLATGAGARGLLASSARAAIERVDCGRDHRRRPGPRARLLHRRPAVRAGRRDRGRGRGLSSTCIGVFGLRARIARLRLGDEEIELIDFLAPEGRPIPADSRSNDRWFQHVAIIVSDMDAAYALLRQHDVQHASSGPQTLPDWNPNAGGIKAFYFKDPDGNHLEILQFPPGKGDPRWQAEDRLFLGIDHTAIVVDDTEREPRLLRRACSASQVAGPVARTTAPSRSSSTTSSAPACRSPASAAARRARGRVPGLSRPRHRPPRPGRHPGQRPLALARDDGDRRPRWRWRRGCESPAPPSSPPASSRCRTMPSPSARRCSPAAPRATRSWPTSRAPDGVGLTKKEIATNSK